MSAARRILHVFSTFAPAGPQLRTVALMEGLGPAWSHVVLAEDGCLDALELVPAGVDAQGLGGARHGLRALRALLREQRPDLLCTYNWGSFDAVLAARSLGLTAHLHHEDGFNADEAQRQKRRRVWARRLLLPRVRRVVVPSRRLEQIAQETWRLPPELVLRVPNGVDEARFRPDAPGGPELRATLGIPPGSLVVGAVGSLRPVKRFDRLLRVCATLPPAGGTREVHVVIAGAGPLRGQLAELARTQRPPRGRVHLIGHRDDLLPVYRAMDVFALTSDSEQLPVSLLEAMAAGVPVVATDVGDVRDVLPEEAHVGLVALDAPAAERALAAVLGRLLADPGRRARLAALGRARVEAAFTRGAMVAAYGALYAAGLGEGNGAAAPGGDATPGPIS